MTGDAKLYRIYLNEAWDLAAIYGFRQTAEDGRPCHTRYLSTPGIEEYLAELWILGITELEFEEIEG